MAGVAEEPEKRHRLCRSPGLSVNPRFLWPPGRCCHMRASLPVQQRVVRALRVRFVVLAPAPASEQSWSPATSGLYAVNAKALPVLTEPFRTEAPEVEALLRLSDAGLRVEEVPVRMEPRAGGVSKLRGRKAVKVIGTVIGTLVAARLLRGQRSD